MLAVLLNSASAGCHAVRSGVETLRTASSVQARITHALIVIRPYRHAAQLSFCGTPYVMTVSPLAVTAVAYGRMVTGPTAPEIEP